MGSPKKWGIAVPQVEIAGMGEKKEKTQYK